MAGISAALWRSAIFCLLFSLLVLTGHYNRISYSPSTYIYDGASMSVESSSSISRRHLYEWTPKPKISENQVGSSNYNSNYNSNTNINTKTNTNVVNTNDNTNNNNNKQKGSCEFSFKLYIYELPKSLLAAGEEARANSSYHVCRKCIYEQFALEYVIFDYFHGFCARTYNPDEADFFYLPIIRDVDYRIALSNRGNRASSPIEIALLNAIEKDDMVEWNNVFKVTDKYWNRHKGSDHIIVMPAPVTNLRHQSSMRGFFHYMIQLNRPIFVNVEYSRSFTQEYPVCARKKNIIAPYPSVDPLLFSGLLPSIFSDRSQRQLRGASLERDRLLFYHGGHHGSCVQVRAILGGIMKDHHQKLTLMRGDRKRELGFRTSIFCAIPIGDSPSSKRMYDVMNYGCIPVILSDELVYAFSLEAGGSIKEEAFSIRLPQRIVQRSAKGLLEDSNPLVIDSSLKAGAAGAKSSSLGYLPVSKLSVYELLSEVSREETADMQALGVSSVVATNSTDAIAKFNFSLQEYKTMNTLIRFLLKIPKEDIAALHSNVVEVSKLYRFYPYNASMSDGVVPLVNHIFPSGDASKMIGNALENMKMNGVQRIANDCIAEKGMKHKYVKDYPCDPNRRC